MHSQNESSRLWTLDEVPALLGLWWLEAVLYRRSTGPRPGGPTPRTAAERHQLEHGHTFGFGCCRG